MVFGNFEQKRPMGNSPKRESIPQFDQNPINDWVNRSRYIIDTIDHNSQLEETEPGVRFSQDLAKLLDLDVIRSHDQLAQVFDNLYRDLVDHDFLMAYNEDTDGFHIHMAHENGPAELGELFEEFSQILKVLPIPENDSILIQKKDLLVSAFKDRSYQLLGK